MAVYAGMQFFSAPVLGNLSDRFGRRPVLLLSLLAMALDYLLMAWAPTLFWLFVGRIIACRTFVARSYLCLGLRRWLTRAAGHFTIATGRRCNGQGLCALDHDWAAIDAIGATSWLSFEPRARSLFLFVDIFDAWHTCLVDDRDIWCSAHGWFTARWAALVAFGFAALRTNTDLWC